MLLAGENQKNSKCSKRVKELKRDINVQPLIVLPSK
jgi:hypothetical protein